MLDIVGLLSGGGGGICSFGRVGDCSWPVNQLIIFFDVRQHPHLIIEDKPRNKVAFSQLGNERTHTAADIGPFVAAHRTRNIKVEHHSKVLDFDLQVRVHLPLEEDTCPLAAGHSHHPEVLLKAEADLNLVKDVADV